MGGILPYSIWWPNAYHPCLSPDVAREAAERESLSDRRLQPPSLSPPQLVCPSHQVVAATSLPPRRPPARPGSGTQACEARSPVLPGLGSCALTSCPCCPERDVSAGWSPRTDGLPVLRAAPGTRYGLGACVTTGRHGRPERAVLAGRSCLGPLGGFTAAPDPVEELAGTGTRRRCAGCLGTLHAVRRTVGAFFSGRTVPCCSWLLCGVGVRAVMSASRIFRWSPEGHFLLKLLRSNRLAEIILIGGR